MVLNIPKLEWEKISQNNPLENKYGHTALALNNKLYIFGEKLNMLLLQF